VRAATCDEALRHLPEAIHGYYAWLRRHGEPAPATHEPIEIEVAGESTGHLGRPPPGSTGPRRTLISGNRPRAGCKIPAALL
jgi:hypothetical protein